MDNEKIIKGNKLIAEFMGLSHTHLQTRLETLKYESSWDWLKPVIDKIIETISVKTIDECNEDEWYFSNTITRMYIGIRIEQAWQLVVNFIEWYK